MNTETSISRNVFVKQVLIVRVPYPAPSPRSTSEWLATALAAIGEAARKPDGWNGRGAPSPKSSAITNSRMLLERLADLKDAPAPSRVKPSAVGGIGITWRNGSKFSYVEADNRGRVSALLADDADDQLEITFPVQLDKAGVAKFKATLDAHLNGQPS